MLLVNFSLEVYPMGLRTKAFSLTCFFALLGSLTREIIYAFINEEKLIPILVIVICFALSLSSVILLNILIDKYPEDDVKDSFTPKSENNDVKKLEGLLTN